MGKYKQSFMNGTLILLAAGIINRLLGFVPRVTLPRIIGAEGVGLYQMGYPFLIVILTFITGGIPLAITKLVAEAESSGNEGRVRNILHVSMIISLSLSGFFTFLCLAAAPWITTHLLTDSRVYYTFLCTTPIIVIVGITSVYRGYFQGRQNMIPTATSQVLETLVRIVAVLIFAYLMRPYGIEYAAAGVMIGVLVGEICGMLLMLLYYWSSKKGYRVYTQANIGTHQKSYSRTAAFKKIVRISIPVTASKLVGSISYFLESIFILQSLAIAGIATSIATAQYGALQGMIIPILFLPSALTFSLSASLIPSLSQAAARNDMQTIHKRLHQSLRLALVTGAPFAVIMYVLAEPLCYYLYNQAEIAVMLKMMAPIALFIYFQAPLQAALQALDRPGTALVNTFIGSVIKLLLIFLLATRPNFGILGAIMAINVNIIIVTLLHWGSVSRFLKFTIPGLDFIKIGLSMSVMGFSCYITIHANWTDHTLTRFIAAMLLGSVVYFICICWLKLINKHDLMKIPWIGKRT